MAIVRDAPLDVPVGEPWGEHYYFGFYDPGCDMGANFHLGRDPDDLDAWRSTVQIFLPGRSAVFLGGGLGHGVGGEGTAGNETLTFSREAEFERWTVRHDGPVRGARTTELAHSPSKEPGDEVVLTADLVFDAIGPPIEFDADEATKAFYLGHYEQLGVLTGTVTLNGEELAISASSLRDHSWGPRTAANIDSYTWGYVSDHLGNGVIVLDVSNAATGAKVCHGKLVTAGAASSVEVLATPRLAEDGWQRSLSLDYALGGDAVRVPLTVLDILPSTADEGGSHLGIDSGASPSAIASLLTPVTGRLDGQPAHGIFARSGPLHALLQP